MVGSEDRNWGCSLPRNEEHMLKEVECIIFIITWSGIGLVKDKKKSASPCVNDASWGWGIGQSCGGVVLNWYL